MAQRRPSSRARSATNNRKRRSYELSSVGESASPTSEYRQARIEREQARKQEQKKLAKRRLLWFAPLAAVLALALLLVGLDLLLYAGKIHRGVEISGISLGGKTRDEAITLLDDTCKRYQETPIAVTWRKESWHIKPKSLGLNFSAKGMVAEAWQVGRARNVFTALAQRLSSWFKPVSIDLSSTTDTEKVAKVFKKLRKSIDKEPVDSVVAYKDDTFTITPGSDGTMLNENELIARLSLAVVEQRANVEAPADVTPMPISEAQARAAAELAERASVEPVAVTYQDKVWTLKPSDIAELFDFKRSDNLENEDVVLTAEPAATKDAAKTGTASHVNLDVVLSGKRISELVVPKLGADVGSEPKDARFKVNGGVVSVVPSKNGSGVDSQQMANELAGILLLPPGSARSIAVVMREVKPKLTTAQAKEMGIKERISTYTTSFGAGNIPRVNNIKLLSKSLDGTLVAPGATFSFNATIGERTAAKGYKEAGAIVKGEIVQQLGGGICQVNTTLFNATLLSGVEIVQRSNHSTYIDHYPLGRDATVSWGGPDFKFKNTLDHPILIVTAAGDSSVTVSFYGVNPGYEVSLTTGEFTRTPFKTTEVKDPQLLEGQRVIETPGQKGGQVVLTQKVTQGDTVVREARFTSRYITVNEVVKVGTKKPATPTKNDKDKSKNKTSDTPVDPSVGQ